MVIDTMEYQINGLSYVIRSARETDAGKLSQVRLQIDGETEYLDREKGEAFIDEDGFLHLIQSDSRKERNIFLIAEADGKIVGFSRCEGNSLRRQAHKVEFGICILQAYWGYGIGRNLLNKTIEWADAAQIKKITLKVLETNNKAISLYEKFGFQTEGILRKDKLLSDGKYYNTIVMGRIKD